MFARSFVVTSEIVCWSVQGYCESDRKGVDETTPGQDEKSEAEQEVRKRRRKYAINVTRRHTCIFVC